MIFGATFAAGWTPCVGAILGSILALAITQPGMAIPLLLSFSIGLTIPFIITGLFISQAAGWISRSERFLKYFNYVAGILLIILGILVFTDNLVKIASFPLFTRWFQ